MDKKKMEDDLVKRLKTNMYLILKIWKDFQLYAPSS